MKVIGLTGGIGTGKSTVARILRERGVPVIDADLVAREVVAPGTPGLAAIVGRFGRGILREDGALDRAALRAIVSRDPMARGDLEAITHPEIFAGIAGRLAELAADGEARAVVEAALMVETGSYRTYDEVVVVTCAPETQLGRVMARDGAPEADARAFIATQMPLAEKEKYATILIRNDGTEADLRSAVLQALP